MWNDNNIYILDVKKKISSKIEESYKPQYIINNKEDQSILAYRRIFLPYS